MWWAWVERNSRNWYGNPRWRWYRTGCFFLLACLSQEPRLNFSKLLTVVVAQSFYDGDIAIRYVLPVLWMSFRTVDPPGAVLGLFGCCCYGRSVNAVAMLRRLLGPAQCTVRGGVLCVVRYSAAVSRLLTATQLWSYHQRILYCRVWCVFSSCASLNEEIVDLSSWYYASACRSSLPPVSARHPHPSLSSSDVSLSLHSLCLHLHTHQV